MDHEHDEGPIVQIAMGIPQAILLGTALGLFITTAVKDAEENPCANDEDAEDLMDTLSSKMIAMEMFAGLSRALRVPDAEIAAMLGRLEVGIMLGDEREIGDED